MLVIAASSALIVINWRRCALIVGAALILVAVLLAVGPLALVWLGVWIMEMAARGHGDDPTPNGRAGRPYRGEEP